MKDFKGKTAFITGAASGIGLGMARAFGHAGMNVVVADIDKAAAAKAVEQLASEQIRAHPVQVDVAERAGVRTAALEAVATFGKVHVVCNNAGVAVGAPMPELTDQDWDWIIDVNLKGVVYGVETFAPLIASHGEGGHIVNTASLAGLISGPTTEPYSATKFAVVGMSEGWQIQLASQGVGVSVLCPGFVNTRIIDSVRTRQDRYGGVQRPSFGPSAAQTESVRGAVATGVDPNIVGERVLEAVTNGDFYIFTDPRFAPIVENRFATIRAGFEAAARSEALAKVKDWAPIGLGQRQQQ
jgi:NAD(P)-dependent dehydrogenase (short-subunit alcohol dehydrogenase family)